MNKLFISIILIVSVALSVFGQNEQYSAPINWELYRVSDKKVSLLLPKLPVLISESNICTQIQTDKYAVYADDVVYGLNISSKLDEEVPDFCSPKKEFDENSFKFRVNEVKNQLKTSESKKVKINNLEAEFIKSDLLNYWLVNDYKNKQWFELWTANSDENKKEVKDFLKSIKIGDKQVGIEINEGSPKNLGDVIIKLPDEKSSEKNQGIKELGSGSGSSSGIRKEKNEKTTDIKSDPITFILKPSPKYTDLARKNNIQGSVTLRITFLSNGGIGSISPVSSLPFGLTEQAIAAAKKIFFLPAKRNDNKISVTKIVQYSFTIY